MKAYLFIETGEVREPKDGELFMTPSGGILRCKGDFGKRSILVRHEIDIPGHLSEIGIYPTKMGYSFPIVTIPIPRTKKRVKRCQYVTINRDGIGRNRGEVTGWLTKEEALDRGLTRFDKIEATEIEVEE